MRRKWRRPCSRSPIRARRKPEASRSRAKPTSAPVAEPETQADNDYRAAKAKCDSGTLTERARSDCLRKAEDEYNQSFTHGGAAAGGGAGTSAIAPKVSH